MDGIKDSEDLNEALIRCMENSFENTDLMYKKAYPDVCNFCGATAVVCVLLGNKLICANVGDARAILCRNGKAVDLSVDHKAVKFAFN